jgi:LuxR family transcriptional regulator of csgAB operon
MEDSQNSAKCIQLLTNSPSLILTELCGKLGQLTKTQCLVATKISPEKRPSLVLVDASNMSFPELYDFLRESYFKQDTLNYALFQLKPDSLTCKLAEWPHIQGIFYQGASINELASGIEEMLQGRICFPSELALQLLKTLRRAPRQNQITPTLARLSRREKQILIRIREGYSNLEIANMLFITEHTIKSHLYGAYRKINVTTRLEASNWAMDNMEDDEDLWK